MIIFSLLFLGDKHLFHKLASIFLFIGGTAITFLDLIAPSNQEGKFYPSMGSSGKEVGRKSDASPSKPKNEDSQPPEVLDSTPNDNKFPSLEENN